MHTERPKLWAENVSSNPGNILCALINVKIQQKIENVYVCACVCVSLEKRIALLECMFRFFS